MKYSVIAHRLASFVVLSIVAVSQALATALDVKASGEKTFYVNPRAGTGQITIFSQSTLEDFTAVCSFVSGEWQVNPSNLEPLRGRFSLRVADIHTGIELRDRHMREEWLDAARYPEVVIAISKLENVKKINASTATAQAMGTCSMHGHTNPVAIPCTLEYLDESPLTTKLAKGDVMRIRAELNVRLSDYGISGPSGSPFVGVKVSDDLNIKVTVVGTTEKPAAAPAKS